MALLSIGYFAAHALIPEVKSNLRAHLGMSAALFYASYAALLYFDTTLPINAPTKLADQVAYLLCALFFLFETRIALGREKWELYTTFGLIAAAACAYSSLPTVVLYVINGQMISASIYEMTLTLASFFFILSRLILMRRLKTDAPSPFVSLIRAVAKTTEEPTNDEELPEETEDEPTPTTEETPGDEKSEDEHRETETDTEPTLEATDGEEAIIEEAEVIGIPSDEQPQSEESVEELAVHEKTPSGEGEAL